LGSRWVYFRESLRRSFTRSGFGLVILVLLVADVLLGSMAVFYFERAVNPTIYRFGDAVWLSLQTMTTVGYGDAVPITVAGRVSCAISMAFGIVLLSVFISSRAMMHVEKSRRRSMGLQRKTSLRSHYVVCGWNQRGEYVLSRLKESLSGEHVPIVLLCGLDEKPVEDDYTFFFHGDPTRNRDLGRTNLEEARGVILLADDSGGGSTSDIDARTVLTALSVRAINPDLRVTAEALESENVSHLAMAGVGEVLDLNEIAGNLLARSALNYGLIGVMTRLSGRDKGTRLYRIPVGEELAGKDYRDLMEQLQEERGYTLMAIESNGKLTVDREGYKVEPDDRLLVMSDHVPLDALDG